MAITTTARGVSNGVNNKRYTYVSDATVAAGASTEVEIVPDKDYGIITEFRFESLSTDCDVYISEITGASATDAETIISIEDINLGYSTAFTSPVSYSTAQAGAKKLYVNVVNNDGSNATGAWTLVLRYNQ